MNTTKIRTIVGLEQGSFVVRSYRSVAFWLTVVIAAMSWPLGSLHAIYVPDENYNPVWFQLPGEQAYGSGAANDDSDGDGLPDWIDQFNYAFGSNLITYWQGGTFHVDGVSTTYPAQWHGHSADNDGDLIPDDIDPYPSDPNNNSFYWAGGTFALNSITHSFRSGWYLGSSKDDNFNGIPDCLEDWYTNPTAHGTLQYWGGGTVLLNGSYSTYGPIYYYAQNFIDSDGDRIPDELDPYPSDPWNNTSFSWNGGDYPINGVMTHFPPGVYGGAFTDSDGDGIPDIVDPLPNDPQNNSAWFQGGSFLIDGVLQGFSGLWHRADIGDADNDGLPDDVDPLPYDPDNWHSFYWSGGSFSINNNYVWFSAATLPGTGLDTDGDGLPDAIDPYPNDPNNGNVTAQYVWQGGNFSINNVFQWVNGGSFSGSWQDSDGDGIPDPADPYPNDWLNGSSEIYWQGGYFEIDNIQVFFSGGNYAGGDSDGDGIPDAADPYPFDPTNNSIEMFTWPGGYFVIDNLVQWKMGGNWYGNWVDTDGDGIPDVADPYPDDPNNNYNPALAVTWPGGDFLIANVWHSFESRSYTFSSWHDSDSDGIPDDLDPYPNDPVNGNIVFYWEGGEYWIANENKIFNAGYHTGILVDSDGDGIPDSLDPYPFDSNNGNTAFYWQGGTYTINDHFVTFQAKLYFGTLVDQDADGIPDSLDPYPSDPNNGNSPTFPWLGGYFDINDLCVYYAPCVLPGTWVDSDGDGIPDVADPYPTNPLNGSTHTFYWGGGDFIVNDLSDHFGAGVYEGFFADSDGDHIPDSLDPYPSDPDNNNGSSTTFHWNGGTYLIDNADKTFDPADYQGAWCDTDGDGIPDVADPYPNDANNGNDVAPHTFPWNGGTFYVNGVAVTWISSTYPGTWSDIDGDGIPDSLDAYPNDPNNNSELWAGGYFSVNGGDQYFPPQWHHIGAGDADDDGIPDDLDALPNDPTNTTTFVWPNTSIVYVISNQEVHFEPTIETCIIG